MMHSQVFKPDETDAASFLNRFKSINFSGENKLQHLAMSLSNLKKFIKHSFHLYFLYG